MPGGTRLDVYLPQLTRSPCSTSARGGRAPRRARITPQQIARGAGDAYLVYLNKAINGYGGMVYMRPMAEMNNPNALYSPVERQGPGGPRTPPRRTKAISARVFLILHGGPRVKIDVGAARRAARPQVKRGMPANPKRKLKVIWNPLAGVGGWTVSYPVIRVGRPRR